MGLKDTKLISVREIEGPVSPHQRQLDGTLKEKKEALVYVTDVSS